MQTSATTPDPLASYKTQRIRRLIDRLDWRIKNLRFAEKLACQAAIDTLHAETDATPALTLSRRAIRAVEIFQARARRLAHAEIRLITA